MSADSPSDAWAVGAVIAHWNGTRWTQMTPPALSHGFLNGVSAVSPTDVWAAGFHGTAKGPQTLTLHWNGTSWQRITSPDPAPNASELWAVSARSASDAWAVGDYDLTGTHSLALHWDGTSVRQIPSPNPGAGTAEGTSLLGVDAFSQSDAWAVGAYGGSNPTQNTLTLHWNGTRWTRTPSPSPEGGAQLNAVSVLSSSDAWAVGSADAGGVLILHWNGKQWQLS